MRNPRLLPLALLLSIGAISPSAAADDKQSAKDFFEKGVAAMEAKNYEEACPAIARSLELDPFPGTLFALAECEALRGRPSAAFQRYGEYLQVYAALPKDKQRKQGTREKDAQDKRAALEKVVAHATLELPADAPAGTQVARDGVTVAAGELGAPIMLDPGEHVFTTQAPGGPSTEQRVTLEKGEQRTLTLEVRVAATGTGTAGPVKPPPGAVSGRRVATYVAGGLGAAGVVLGAVTGGLMLAQLDAINAGCTDSGTGVASCTPEAATAGNDAKTFGNIATAGFAAGLALAGVAVVLFVTEPRPAKAKAADSGSSWLGVGLSVGPRGTTVGVRGRF
jgi:tetratricopeptide (TPR) repeat protein